MKGQLVLIPTPIDEKNPLEPVAFKRLQEAALEHADTSIFVVEDQKPGRRRWLHFGLPRAAVEQLFLYNEHSKKEDTEKLLQEMQRGKTVYLMSDGGLPAFLDPGTELIDLCHKYQIKVTSTPFSNSVVLALALSGFNHNRFIFEGFLELEKGLRKNQMESMLQQKSTVIFLDTPYRLKRTLEELAEIMAEKKRSSEVFLALDLNSDEEELLRATPELLLKKINSWKREFVAVLSPT